MITRRASCSCGQLSLVCEGEPVRISICHCIACQRRTGSAFGVQARFPESQVQIQGQTSTYVRAADSGNALTFHFCSTCSSTVYWHNAALPGFYGVAVGAFADPKFPPPFVSVYEERMHSWAMALGALDIEHLD